MTAAEHGAPPGRQGELFQLGVKPSLRNYLRQIWSRRDFTITVPLGDLRAQHRNTLLGSIWHLFNPLLLGAVYFLIFGVIFNQAGAIENYVTFLLIGLFIFQFTSKAMSTGARTVISNMALIQSLTFPRAVLPISAVIGETLAFLPSVAVMAIAAVVTGEPVSITWLLVLPALGLQALFNLGITFFTARMTFHFRDTLEILPYITRLWMYLSGVFYTVDRIPEGPLRTAFELNPLHAYISMIRSLFMDAAIPERHWAIGAAWALGLALAGFLFFRARESDYGRGY